MNLDRIVSRNIKQFLKENVTAEYINSRLSIPKVRGGWNTNKIIKYLKSNGSYYSTLTAIREIADFDNVDELESHLFWHGSQYLQTYLKPSITKSEKWAEQYGGGGYGDRYYAVSLTKRKKTASNFAMNARPIVHPVIVAKDAVIKDMEGKLQDAYDLEEIIVDLYTEGVDAVWIGGGEGELCVINPRCIINVSGASQFYNMCYNQGHNNDSLENPTKEQLETLLNLCKNYIEYLKENPKPNKPKEPNERFKDREWYKYDKMLDAYNKYKENPTEIDNAITTHNQKRDEIINALKFRG